MPARTLSGIIVSDVNDKTIVVSVSRRFKHNLYTKAKQGINNTMYMDSEI